MLGCANITKVISLLYFLSSGQTNKFGFKSSVFPIRRTVIGMSSSAMGNDDIDEGWSDVSKKNRKQNKSKSNPKKTLKQKNPYIEVIDPTIIESDGTAARDEPSTTHEPFMVLLVGLPGSGKSTFSQSLVASMPNKFCRINQDELKTRPKCEKKLKQVLSVSPTRRLCPIIDRCNFDGKQRSTWYRLAEEAAGQGSLPTKTDISNDTTGSGSKVQPPLGIPVDVVVLDLPYEECLRRCQMRKGHETIKSPQQAAGVLKQLRREWSPPHYAKNAEEKSKYRSLTIVRTDKERKDCLLRILKQTW